MKNLTLILLVYSLTIAAQEKSAEVTYLGNEAIFVQDGDYKIMFDPFFHNGFNHYQLVPKEMRQAIFDNIPPYDHINAIFISHAHGDHFAADDMLNYLQKHTKTKLVAPGQAIDKINALVGSDKVKKQMFAIKLERGDKPESLTVDGLTIEAVRIPHAGWPGRAEVSNLVFRVTLAEVTIMHMGDADPNDTHFKPYKEYWDKIKTDAAFPPYWFFTSEDGQIILDERINANKSIGIHVPIKVPFDLEMSGEMYFSKSGNTRTIEY